MSSGEAGRGGAGGRRLSERVLQKVLHGWWRVSRPMTLGVRVAVIDPAQGVLLVRHGYVSGWHLPGGGVEAGETAFEALAREAREEAEVEFLDPPSLHGVFFNRRVSKRDHVLVYVARRFRRTGEVRPSREIAECRFFQLDALPDDTSPGTLARLAEIMSGRPASPYW
jgi:ADP-ribose pyrophosphatase YjhB (NUDIX family)